MAILSIQIFIFLVRGHSFSSSFSFIGDIMTAIERCASCGTELGGVYYTIEFYSTNRYCSLQCLKKKLESGKKMVYRVTDRDTQQVIIEIEV